MAIPVATGQVVQVLHQYDLEGQACENVWYFRAEAADPDMLLNLLTDIAQCLLTTLIPKLSSSYTLYRLRGKVVSPAVGLEADWYPEPGEDIAGAAAGDASPSFQSAVVSLRTERPGREGKGRIYIGGVPEGDTLKSYINVEGPLWIAIAAFLACMLDKFSKKDLYAAGDYTWGVMSRKLGGLKPPFAANGYALIIEAQPQRLLGTTRSRMVGRGR